MVCSPSKQELLVKSLICLLLPKDFQLAAQCIVDNNIPEKSSLVKKVYIQVHPAKTLSVTKVSSKVLDDLCAILGVGSQVFKATLSSITATTNLTTIVHDLYIYRHLLQMDWIPFLPNFQSKSHLKEFKDAEDKSLEALLKQKLKCDNPPNIVKKYQDLDPSRKYLLLEIIDATNLLAKDSNKSSNPYCMVSYSGMEFSSNISQSNCNPKFDFSIPLYFNF